MTPYQYLTKLWSHAPFSWAIIRANELLLLEKETFKPPILEVGCGDGIVSSLLFKNKKGIIDIGIDLDRSELKRAEKTKIYKKLIQADITNTEFASNSFNTIFTNGVLEHIPDLESALNEISRLLKKDGKLITTSPTDNYGRLLFYSRILNFLHLGFLGNTYAKTINTFFCHKHLYEAPKWKQILERKGFRLVKYTYYNGPITIATHDICLPFAILAKFLKRLTDQMVLFPRFRNIFVRLLVPTLNKFIDWERMDQNSKNSASILLIAQKK